MSEINHEFLEIFIEEAQDNLEEWEKSTLDYEKGRSFEDLSNLFRLAHSLKGTSRGVGFVDFSDFIHKTEDLLEKTVEKQIEATDDLIPILYSLHSFMNDWVEKILEDLTYTPDSSDLLSDIQKYVDTHTKGGGGTPEKESVAKEEDELVEFNHEEKEIEKAPEVKAEEVIVEKEAVAENKKPAPEKKEVEKPKPKDEQKKQASKGPDSLRISSSKLDSLLMIVGELAVQNEILYHEKEKGQMNSKLCLDAISLLNKGLKDLQTTAFSLRMLPLSGLFRQLDRTARDVSRSQQKKINIELEGEDVELDKSVIEKIKDPLVHMVRNAVDHGLEIEEKRLAKGKTSIGTMKIIAENKAGAVSICISDDGNGIDPEVIRKKAIQKGVIQENTEISDNDLQRLVFHPGFSTAEQVTNISGRGVGMDVVQRSIVNLGGAIQINSKKGVGTLFEISIPSTLSIVDALVLEVNDLKYAVPLNEIDEIVNLDRYALQRTSNSDQAFLLRGETVPVESLLKFFKNKQMKIPEDKDHKLALIYKSDTKKIAFLVDRIIGQQSVVVRALEGSLEKVPGISGGTILGNGEPGLIINLNIIARDYFMNKVA